MKDLKWKMQCKIWLFKSSGVSNNRQKRPLWSKCVWNFFKLSPLTHNSTKPSPRPPHDSTGCNFGSVENWVQTLLKQRLFVSTSLTRLWTHDGRALISPSAALQRHDLFIRRPKCWQGSTSQRQRKALMSHAVCHMTSWQPRYWKHPQQMRVGEEEESGIFAGVDAEEAH